MCRHCGATVGELSAEDQRRKESLKRYKQSQNIQTQSMIAMLMFVLGFAIMFWGGTEVGESKYTASLSCSVIGFIWCIVNRVRLVILKKGQ